MLVTGKKQYTLAIINAYLSFYKLFIVMYKKRIPGINKYYQKFSVFFK